MARRIYTLALLALVSGGARHRLPEGGLDEEGERLVDAICQMGVPTVVGVLQGTLPQKQAAAARKQWAASLEARFPDHSKLFSLDLAAVELVHLLREFRSSSRDY